MILGETEVHVVQSLTASLGANGGGGGSDGDGGGGGQSMATVCRVTRTLMFPPQLKTLRDWFLYAFANSDIDGKYTYTNKHPYTHAKVYTHT